MIDIFTDLYKKVLSFFQTQEKENTESKNFACNRLKLVLMQDRTNLTPFLLERMRGEMIDVLSKYVEMDKEALELNFEQEGDSIALMLSIPVIRAKEEEEIQAAIKAEEEVKAKAEAEKIDAESEVSDENETTEEANAEEADEEASEMEKAEIATKEVSEEINAEMEEITEESDSEDKVSEKKPKKKD